MLRNFQTGRAGCAHAAGIGLGLRMAGWPCAAGIAAALSLGWPLEARAQLINRYLQTSVPGFDRDRGVTVLQRPRPGYDEPTIYLDGVAVHADLDQSIGYDSDVSAMPQGAGSWFVRTAPAFSGNITGPRGTAGGAFTLEDIRYLDLPAQNRTDWTASLGTSYRLGHDTMTLGYAHLAETLVSSTELGALSSVTPIPYTADDVRADYTARLGRFLLTPELAYDTVNFDSSHLIGQPSEQRPLDYTTLTAGVTLRYPLASNRSLVLVVEDVDTAYAPPPPGVLDASSQSLDVLGGLDYQQSGVWRYRLLAGLERRTFSSGQSAAVTPVAEASVTWTPSGIDTITATLTRRSEQSSTPGVGSYTYTNAALVLDHELRHNVLLRGRGGVEFAEYTAGGSQSRYALGGGVTWLLSPRLRLSADYDYTRQTRATGATLPVSTAASAPLSGGYAESLLTLRLHIAL